MISGIYLAATFVSVVAMAALGAILFWRSDVRERRVLFVILVACLPLSAGAFHLVRMPLDHWLAAVLAEHPNVLTGLRLCYAPLTEEPAKLLVFCIPWIWRRLERQHVTRMALAVGLGFGVGEAWMLAQILANRPDIAGQPWYALQGFIIERTLVCITHAGFTSIALLGLSRRHLPVAVGMVALAMCCHFLANLPIFMASHGFGLSTASWSVLLMLWVQTLVILSVVWLARLSDWRIRDLVWPGLVRCPECRGIYKPPVFLGLNFLDRRYERCSLCKKWHMVTAKDRVLLTLEERQA